MFQTGIAAGYADFLDKLNAFLTAGGAAWGVRFAGVGTGRLVAYNGGVSGVAQTITLTATSATEFAVSGSVSGPLGVATVDVAFTSAAFQCTVQSGTTAFAAGDTFTLVTAPAWQAVRAQPGSEYIWKGPGADGQGAIFVGARTYAAPGTDTFGLELQGFSGFDAGSAFNAQPGAITSTNKPCLPLWTGEIQYWFVASGRSVRIVAKVSTTYQSAYLGLLEQYIDPATYPYPLAIGGSANGQLRYSASSTASNAYPMASVGTAAAADTDSQLRLRLPTGVWKGFHATVNTTYAATYSLWPYNSRMSALRTNLDGTHPLIPVVLNDNTPQVYGQLEGIRATTGHSTSTESVISSGYSRYLVVQNVNRTDLNQFFAMELD